MRLGDHAVHQRALTIKYVTIIKQPCGLELRRAKARYDENATLSRLPR